MFLFIIGMIFAGMGGVFGYVLGAVIADNLFLSLVLGAIGSVLAFLVFGYFATRSGARGHGTAPS